MKKRVLTSIVLSLVALPSMSVLANTNPSEQDITKMEMNLIQAEQNLKSAKEKDAIAKDKINDGAFAFFDDLGDEGKACLEILNTSKYSDSIKRGVKGDATSTENILKTFERIRMANLLRNSYELKGNPNAELKVTSKMMAMAMANADYSANVIEHASQFPVAEIASWGYIDPFDGWYWGEKGNYFLKEGKKFTSEMELFFEKNPYLKERLDVNGQIGHYFIVVSDRFNITGYAICNRKGTKYGVCEVEDFNYLRDNAGEKIYTVDEYEILFTNWYQELKNSKEILKNAQEKTNTLKTEYNNLLKKYYGAHITKKGDKYVMYGPKGEIVKNVWGEKDGKLYYASNDGYLINDRIEKIDNEYRGFDSEGALVTGWSQINSNIYYFDKDGILLRNEWVYDKESEKWFFVNENGQCVTNTWKGSYYLKNNGQMAKNEWIYDDNYQSWFYINEDGTYAQNKWVGNYYLKQWGYMAKSEWAESPETGWHYFNPDGTYVQNKWVGSYYLKQWGYMAQNEWIYDKNYQSWFYIKEDGSYAQNQWIGSYYLKQWGYMAKNEWIYDNNYQSWFYIKEDGSYAQKKWVGNYYLKQWGYMASNEWIWDDNYNNWFYIAEDGHYVRNAWIGNYYLTKWGEMAKGKVYKERKNWIYTNKNRYFYDNKGNKIGSGEAKKVVDVSEWQGKIDWKYVMKHNDIDAVIVRIGYGSTGVDKYAKDTIKQLNDLNIPYGIYLYSYASNGEDGKAEAKHTVELLKEFDAKPTYPIYFDVEDWVRGEKRAPTDTKTWLEIITAYIETMTEAGIDNVDVYSYRALLQDRLNHPDILKHVTWVAAYTNELGWKNPYYQGNLGWQYTATEKMEGLGDKSGSVDVSVWY